MGIKCYREMLSEIYILRCPTLAIKSWQAYWTVDIVIYKCFI